MLVIKRNEGTWLDIGNNIHIQIVEVGHGFVRLGIEAPVEIPVNRREITERIRVEGVIKRVDSKQ